MDEADLEALARAAHGRFVPDDALRRALARLAERLAPLAAALRVAHDGPGVGVEGRADAYLIAVRAHRLSLAGEPRWGVMICDGAPAARGRAVWALAAAGRRRQRAVARALPDFLRGYVGAVRASGLADTEPGHALEALATAWLERFEAVR